jgi:hypothetical protein
MFRYAFQMIAHQLFKLVTWQVAIARSWGAVLIALAACQPTGPALSRERLLATEWRKVIRTDSGWVEPVYCEFQGYSVKFKPGPAGLTARLFYGLLSDEISNAQLEPEGEGWRLKGNSSLLEDEPVWFTLTPLAEEGLIVWQGHYDLRSDTLMATDRQPPRKYTYRVCEIEVVYQSVGTSEPEYLTLRQSLMGGEEYFYNLRNQAAQPLVLQGQKGDSLTVLLPSGNARSLVLRKSPEMVKIREGGTALDFPVYLVCQHTDGSQTRFAKYQSRAVGGARPRRMD